MKKLILKHMTVGALSLIMTSSICASTEMADSLKVTYEQALLKVGLQNQVEGTLTLAETDSAMFQEGEITFSIKKDNKKIGIYLEEIELEMSNNINGEIISDKDEERVSIKIDRETKEKGTITLKSMTFTTDRTVPEGTYDLEIYGTGIDTYGNCLIVEDFINVTTPATCDFQTSSLINKSNELNKGIVTFGVGEHKYIYQNQEFIMDASAYIQDPGYIMVPVRYLAEAFGLSETDILFNQDTITIFQGDKIISLTVGSNMAVVNGNNIGMGTKIINKDGRIYAPASQIADLLGLQSEWDQETKIAQFIND